ncbi:hypothetical protein CV102_04085 [Natronococcus pandeyae]|uniref:Uncharacterized protein n=1 Tax=Natronococcus pandeyae TaxID=2055836 RepID=A0A8J8Q6H3_9EURY|nr:hypothetical protein CV102_04085 [Natronococcus pandeyae]
MLHGPKTAQFDIDAEYVTTIVVSPLSDIWFEDTEIGLVNRRSLASFLERIEDAFSVATIERTSEWVPVEDLEAIY